MLLRICGSNLVEFSFFESIMLSVEPKENGYAAFGANVAMVENREGTHFMVLPVSFPFYRLVE